MVNPYIAVFDSGLGGLAVLRALQKAYPRCSFVFLADNAELPLGDKPKERIREVSLRGAQILSARPGGCAALVIACGTSSAYAYPLIRDALSCPVIEMIGPTAEYLFSLGSPQSVGVMATAATISSGRYPEEITCRSPLCTVFQRPTPALVPLIEGGKGSLENQVTQELKSFPENTEAFILGCTHYTLIKEMVQHCRPGALVVDSPPAVIENLKDFVPPPQEFPVESFLCTQKDGAWEERSARLMGRSILWEEIRA